VTVSSEKVDVLRRFAVVRSTNSDRTRKEPGTVTSNMAMTLYWIRLMASHHVHEKLSQAVTANDEVVDNEAEVTWEVCVNFIAKNVSAVPGTRFPTPFSETLQWSRFVSSVSVGSGFDSVEEREDGSFYMLQKGYTLSPSAVGKMVRLMVTDAELILHHILPGVMATGTLPSLGSINDFFKNEEPGRSLVNVHGVLKDAVNEYLQSINTRFEAKKNRRAFLVGSKKLLDLLLATMVLSSGTSGRGTTIQTLAFASTEDARRQVYVFDGNPCALSPCTKRIVTDWDTTEKAVSTFPSKTFNICCLFILESCAHWKRACRKT
jgi:hypothetical protein